jgi:deoxyadenosine/deoxycytidine kinase
MAYISRLDVIRKEIKKNPNAIFISERSLFTDKLVFAKMLFDSGNIELVNYKIYLKWFDTFAEDFPVNKVIYVNTLPEICHKRIIKRSRTGESNIPLDYLKNCHKYHNNMLDTNSEDCICKEQLILNGNVDIYENKEQINEWIDQINMFIHN